MISMHKPFPPRGVLLAMGDRGNNIDATTSTIPKKPRARYLIRRLAANVVVDNFFISCTSSHTRRSLLQLVPRWNLGTRVRGDSYTHLPTTTRTVPSCNVSSSSTLKPCSCTVAISVLWAYFWAIALTNSCWLIFAPQKSATIS